MERLTRWNEQTEQAELVEYDTEEWKDFKSTLYDLDEHFVSTAINQLAIYEDTGLEPHQIDAICDQLNALVDEVLEYKTAEEQGLLLRLPYNLGTCGVLYYACEEDSEVYRLRADEVTISKTMISNKFCYLIDSLEFCFEDFGKIIFRTKAEAEKALAEMR